MKKSQKTTLMQLQVSLPKKIAITIVIMFALILILNYSAFPVRYAEKPYSY
jgi:hypothetical protein